MDERSSSRASGTTYHSFNDVELFEPASPPRPPVTYDSSSLQHLEHLQQELQRQQREAIQREAAAAIASTTATITNTNAKQERRPSTAIKMQRQDSGYESTTPPRRTSTSTSRPSVGRWPSTGSSSGTAGAAAAARAAGAGAGAGTGVGVGAGVGAGVVATSTTNNTITTQHPAASPSTSTTTSFPPRSRPSFRRAAKSLQYQQSARSSAQSLVVRSTTASTTTAVPKPGGGFFHFPSPEPIELADAAPDARTAPTPAPTPPPQTTHYWTSDRTRRLEYAAIDAATMGVKGWVMRHLVPECFVPRELRHVSFDDDSGSVRRYRLELEEDHHDEKHKMGRGKGFRRGKGWRFWRRRRENTGPVVIV